MVKYFAPGVEIERNKVMKKNNGLIMGVFAVVFVLFNFIVLFLVENKTPVFWVTYGFSVIAFLLLAANSFLALKRATTLNDIFFGLPLDIISGLYLSVQIASMLLFNLIPNMNIRWVVVLEVIILACYLILSMSALLAKNVVVDIDHRQKEKVFYIKSLDAEIEGLVIRVTDLKFKKQLLDLQEVVRYSDPMSDDSLCILEQKIEAKASAMAEAIETGNLESAAALCQEIHLLFLDRNRKCKLLK